jgi:ribosomal protein L37AE/L43A
MADGDKPRHEPPICPRCNTSDRVRPLTMSDMIGGVRYWWCDSCGNVWGTRERKDAR